MDLGLPFSEESYRYEPNKINQLLLNIKKYDKKESIAGYVASAMKECGYSKEKIYQVIAKLNEEIDKSKTEESRNWKKLLP
jgi:hypothetical protein